jgi:hypothetical protein
MANPNKGAASKVPGKKASAKKASAKKASAKKASAGKPGARPPASTKPVWQKLLVKGGTVLLLNAPSGFEKLFAGSPARVTTRPAGTAETVLLFASSAAQLDASMPSAIAALSPSSTFWIAYRKGDKSFHRDIIGSRATTHGYNGVAMIAIDDEMSALRVRPTPST